MFARVPFHFCLQDLPFSFPLACTTDRAAQPLLLFEPMCPCGTGPLETAGMCRPWYRQRWHSLRRFGGHREEVLVRDGYRCRVCASGEYPIEHHRAPVEDADWMITVSVNIFIGPKNIALWRRITVRGGM